LISPLVRFALILGKTAITVFLLWFALRHIDYSRIGADIASAQRGTLFLAVLVLAFQPLLGALRWHVIMRRFGAPITPRQSVRLTYISTFLNQVLPGGVGGDAMRMWLSFREGHQLSHALNGVALDRVVGFVALIMVATMCVTALDRYPQLRALEISLLPIAVLAFLGTGTIMLLDRLPVSLRRFRSVRGLGYLAKDARQLFLSPRMGPVVVVLSVLGIANLCTSLFLFMQAFNVPLAPWLLAVSVPPVILASSLPISVGGWGTREAAVVVMMTALAAPSEPGIVASIAFGLAGILISLPGAFFLQRSLPDPGRARPTPGGSHPGDL